MNRSSPEKGCIRLLHFCYPPLSPLLCPIACTILSSTAKTAFFVTGQAEANYKLAINTRKTAFKTFPGLIAWVNNALKASDATREMEETVASLVRKLRGQRATPKMTETQKLTAAAKGESVREISSAQTGIDHRLEFFGKLIRLLSSIPSYKPNETTLKVESLISVLENLRANNAAVITAEDQLNNARIHRNEILYSENTGMADIAQDVKTYVKSVFGASSPQYRKISKLRIKKQ